MFFLKLSKGISLNKSSEDLSTVVLTKFDAETGFGAMAAQGNIEEDLTILDKLDQHFAENNYFSD